MKSFVGGAALVLVLVAGCGGDDADEPTPSGGGTSSDGGSAAGEDGAAAKAGTTSDGGTESSNGGTNTGLGGASGASGAPPDTAGADGAGEAGAGPVGEGDFVRFKYNGEQYDTRDFVSEFPGYAPRVQIIDDRLAIHGFFDDSIGSAIYVHWPDAKEGTVECDSGEQMEIKFVAHDRTSFKVWPGNTGFLAENVDLGCTLTVSQLDSPAGQGAGEVVTGTFEGVLYHDGGPPDHPHHAYITEGSFSIKREN